MVVFQKNWTPVLLDEKDRVALESYAWWGWVDNDMWVGRDLAELAGQLVRAERCARGSSCDGVSTSGRDLNAESKASSPPKRRRLLDIFNTTSHGVSKTFGNKIRGRC